MFKQLSDYFFSTVVLSKKIELLGEKESNQKWVIDVELTIFFFPWVQKKKILLKLPGKLTVQTSPPHGNYTPLTNFQKKLLLKLQRVFSARISFSSWKSRKTHKKYFEIVKSSVLGKISSEISDWIIQVIKGSEHNNLYKKRWQQIVSCASKIVNPLRKPQELIATLRKNKSFIKNGGGRAVGRGA
jgi:hypothetical protein